MSATLILLHLAGYVALLLWGMHMVHTGIVRAFGGHLRQMLSVGLKSRWKAFLAGMGITALLQSSTATALMCTSFIAGGFMALVPALAVTLGANVGTTLIVQVLTFNVAAIAPVFVLIGLIAFNKGGKTRTRDLGRVAIGVGLILLALNLIIATIEPVEKAKALRELFAMLSGDPIIDIAIGALLTWAAYSSVAVVLLIMTLAAQEIVPPVAALAFVLGANLGNVIPQYLAAGTSNAAKRLALGNLIVRGVGCLVAIPLLPWLAKAMAGLEASPARQVADFHTLFNLALALIFIGLLDPLARLCTKLLPAGPSADEPGKPQYLNPAVIGTPSLALADAAREVLRMVDMVEAMLRTFLEALEKDDRKLLAQLAAMDDTLDTLHNAVKLHLTAISREEGLSESGCPALLRHSRFHDQPRAHRRHPGQEPARNRRQEDQAAPHVLAGGPAGNRGHASAPARQSASGDERVHDGRSACGPYPAGREGPHAGSGAGCHRQSSAPPAGGPGPEHRDQHAAP